MNKLDTFLSKTESGASTSFEAPKQVNMKYPFIYIAHITTVELAHYMKEGILHRDAETPEDVQFFLKNGAYKFLGYVTLSIRSLTTINALSEHTIMLKRSKADEVDVAAGIVNMLLLKE